jgi:hypothetical protein
MRKTSLALAATVLAVCMAVAALAHHSPAIFDRTKEVKLVGVVKEFRWSNPHSWIELNVSDNGANEQWAVEMNPPTNLVKAGWKSTTIKAGDQVTITINPLRTSEKVGKFVSITLPDGKILTDSAPVAPTR